MCTHSVRLVTFIFRLVNDSMMLCLGFGVFCTVGLVLGLGSRFCNIGAVVLEHFALNIANYMIISRLQPILLSINTLMF